MQHTGSGFCVVCQVRVDTAGYGWTQIKLTYNPLQL